MSPSRNNSAEVISVWPCGHGDVIMEPFAVSVGNACAECGAHPRQFVPKAEADRYREALEWIVDDVDEGEMRKWARQALDGDPLTQPGQL